MKCKQLKPYMVEYQPEYAGMISDAANMFSRRTFVPAISRADARKVFYATRGQIKEREAPTAEVLRYKSSREVTITGFDLKLEKLVS